MKQSDLPSLTSPSITPSMPLSTSCPMTCHPASSCPSIRFQRLSSPSYTSHPYRLQSGATVNAAENTATAVAVSRPGCRTKHGGAGRSPDGRDRARRQGESRRSNVRTSPRRATVARPRSPCHISLLKNKAHAHCRSSETWTCMQSASRDASEGRSHGVGRVGGIEDPAQRESEGRGFRRAPGRVAGSQWPWQQDAAEVERQRQQFTISCCHARLGKVHAHKCMRSDFRGL